MSMPNVSDKPARTDWLAGTYVNPLTDAEKWQWVAALRSGVYRPKSVRTPGYQRCHMMAEDGGCDALWVLAETLKLNPRHRTHTYLFYNGPTGDNKRTFGTMYHKVPFRLQCELINMSHKSSFEYVADWIADNVWP